MNYEFLAGLTEGEGCFLVRERAGVWVVEFEIWQKRPDVLTAVMNAFPSYPWRIRAKREGWVLALGQHASLDDLISHIGPKLLAKRREAEMCHAIIGAMTTLKGRRVGASKTLDAMCYAVVAMKGQNTRDDLALGVPPSAEKLNAYLNRRVIV